ncbi:MAG: hypothetical protein JW973_12115 [Bacteroidales bacterium]|nr:hypothetical protein [Bacteroidales bacterium]
MTHDFKNPVAFTEWLIQKTEKGLMTWDKVDDNVYFTTLESQEIITIGKYSFKSQHRNPVPFIELVKQSAEGIFLDQHSFIETYEEYNILNRLYTLVEPDFVKNEILEGKQ